MNEHPPHESRQIELITSRRVLPSGRKPAWLLSESARPEFNSEDLFCVPHHWEDPKKKASDYQYLEDLHARVLEGLGQALNELHGVERSMKAWDVLIGYWLTRTLSFLLDQWETVRGTAESGRSFDFLVSSLTQANITPSNTNAALSWMHSDSGNEAILLLIAQQFRAFQPVQTELAYTAINPGETVHFLVRKQLSTLKEVAISIARRRSRTTQAELFFIETGLTQNLRGDIRETVGDRLSSPHFSGLVRYPKAKSSRTWQLQWRGIATDFERWLQAVLPELLPTAYLENFAYLDNRFGRPVPQRPFIALTKSAHSGNEGFKFWFSRHGDEFGRLAVLGHGGGPIDAINTDQRWERNLADRFLTTGPANEAWGEQVRSVGFLINAITHEFRPSGQALFVSTVIRRFTQAGIFGTPLPSQVPRYFDDMANLVNSLPEEIRKNFKLRLYPKVTHGWDQKAEWKKRVPDVVFGSERQGFKQAVAESRLVVVPYRGSTYIQTLHANVPTIIFFSPLWPLGDVEKDYFSMLSDVGVFHSNATTAAAKIAEVWPGVEQWWFSEPVQEAVGVWNGAFARDYGNPVSRVLEQLDFS